MSEAWKRWEGEVVDGMFPLRQFLAGGESSAVYLTEYGEQGSQKAAIKLVQADPGSFELPLSRWERAAKLSHPNLIRLFQTGTFPLGGSPMLYLVTEYADDDLSQVLPARPLTAEEAQQMLELAIGALTYLHNQGLVHGRLKPANIMAVGDALKISSDGLGRPGDAPDSTSPGIYDPPEIHQQGISPAGDMWSLGVTLVECLTQRPPIWDRERAEDPRLPETLPSPFLEIAGHCLRRNPKHRWTAADVEIYLRPDSSVTRQTARDRPRPALTKRRYLAPAAVLGLALAALLAGPRLLERQPDTTRALPAGPPRHEPEAEQKPAAQTPPVVASSPPVATTSQDKPASPAVSPPLTVAKTNDDALASAVVSPRTAQPEPASPPPPPTPVRAKTNGKIVPGKVLQEVLPDVSPSASRTITGTVRVSVRVQVDPSGRVASAELASPGPSKYFAGLALRAAERWEFTPATVGNQPVPSEWTLRFAFTRTAVRAASAFVSKQSETTKR
jgi:TonB family protein